MVLMKVGEFARRSRWQTNLLYRCVSAAPRANAICSICGLDGAVYISDGTAPECKVCIEYAFWVDQRTAVAETHQKRMIDIIHKCGKTAGVQLTLTNDARRVIAACLWSGCPWVGGPDTGDANIFGYNLLRGFVPSPHRATWRTVTDSHFSLHWKERTRRTQPSIDARYGVRSRGRSRGRVTSRSRSPDRHD